MNKMKTLKVLKYIGFGVLGTGFVFLVIWGVMALWNCLIPAIFNGPELTYWQTFGLFFLTKILLTGVAPRSGHNDSRKSREWRRRCAEKYAEHNEHLNTGAYSQPGEGETA
jgi:hypothetical protein